MYDIIRYPKQFLTNKGDKIWQLIQNWKKKNLVFI